MKGFKTANVLNSAACPLDENAPAVARLRRDGFQHRYFTPPSPSDAELALPRGRNWVDSTAGRNMAGIDSGSATILLPN